MLVPAIAKYMLALGASMGLLGATLVADEESTKDSQAPSALEEKPKMSKEEVFAPQFLNKLSQAYGHLIQKSLTNPYVTLNMSEVIKGMQDAGAGKASPMPENEYEEAIKLIQHYAFDDMLVKNLNEANDFLKKNASQEGVIEIEPGKLQYKLVQAGTGDLVTEQTEPTIHYSGTYLNGTSLGSTEQHGGPIEIHLSDTIPGFRSGILGMKVGEKRRLFIHPDLGYGRGGQIPNGMLIFDLEVVKVEPVKPSPADYLNANGGELSDDESDDESEESDDDVYQNIDDFDDEDDSDDADDDNDDEDENDDDDDEETEEILRQISEMEQKNPRNSSSNK